MKVKADFITNSSSTSFIFLFKGDHIDLYRKLFENESSFNLTYYDFNDVKQKVNVEDVIRSIDEVLRIYNDEMWVKPSVKNIDELIKDTKESIIYWEEETSGIDKDEFYLEILIDYKNKLKKLEKIKERGLTSSFIIGFGDNHGEISGGRIGVTMDYEGRKITIDKDDFVVFTEQNR